MEKKNTYPIKAVSLQTGLSIHVIRAWEKRYQAIVPQRTDTNRRLYSDDDIAKLLLLKRCTEAGHNIGNVASLSISGLKELVTSRNEIAMESDRVSYNSDKEALSFIDKCIKAVKGFNSGELEKTLFDASLQLNQHAFLDSVVIPFIKRIGDMWHDGEIRIMHEHMATAILKAFLSNMRNNYRPAENAPQIIVTTPIGQNHELGALILSLISAVEGWNVTYLGPNLPAEEILIAVKEKKAKAVLLSIVYPANDHILKKDILKLKGILPENVTVIVGGKLADSYKSELDAINAMILQDVTGFRKQSSIIMNL